MVRERSLILVVSFCAMVFAWGTPFSFGVLIDPLTAEFGYSDIQVSGINSTLLLSFYAFAAVLGILTARVSVRLVLFASAAVVLGAGVLFQFVASYYALVFVFLGLGTMLGTPYVVLAAVVPQWFEDREATSLGILMAGNGLGIQIMPPIWSWAIDALDLGTAFLAINLSTAVVFAIAGVVVSRPRNAADRDATAFADVLGWARRLLGRRKFWLAFVGTGFLFGWYYVLAAQAIPMFVERGFGKTEAAFLFGLIGGVSVVSRVLSGLVAEYVGPRVTIQATAYAVGGAFVVLLLDGVAPVVLAVAVFGLGFGTAGALYLPALSSGFDVREPAVFVGLFNFSFAIFAFVAPLASTVVLNATGSYSLLLAGTGLLTVFGTTLFWIGSG